MSRTMACILAGIVSTLVAFGVLLGFGLLSQRGATVFLLGGMELSLYAGLLCSSVRRFSLLQLVLIFLIASIEIGLFVEMAQVDKAHVPALFFATLLFPMCGFGLGMLLLRRFTKSVEDAKPVEHGASPTEPH